ncbi:MAG: hypothetical protein AB1668_02405 [Nanoarchaeota archaeon]
MNFAVKYRKYTRKCNLLFMFFVALISLITISLITISLASAENGCFIYPDSAYFCTDLDEGQATKECLFYDCSLLEMFYSGESCSDSAKFPQCQKIICKSSCKEEFSGKCASGPIPEGKQQEWCTSGCCQFDYIGGSFCAFKTNKWLCEVEARNKDVVQYIFAQPMAEYECTQKCSAGEISVKKALEGQGEKPAAGMQVEKVSPQPLSLPLSRDYTGAEKQPSKELKGELLKEESSSSKSSVIIWLFAIFVFVGLLYFLYRWQSGRNLFSEKVPGAPEGYGKSIVSPGDAKHFNFFSLNPFAQRRISLLKAKRKHKRVIKEQKEVFSEFGQPAKVKSPVLSSDSFTKLKKVVRLSLGRPAAEKKGKSMQKDVFEKVREIAHAAREKEKELIRKEESQEALKKLKEIAGKKK